MKSEPPTIRAGVGVPGGAATSGHREDIDGLRAIAILSVLGFHAFPRWVPGGFAGVDLFFVISGYLISKIIFMDLERGRFSFADFYARRARRILPALALVLATVWITGWYCLLTDEFEQLGRHIAAGAGFVANVALWRESGYFDRLAELKPLLHLWSLGVEEQFYFLWPALLVIAWRPRIERPLILIVALASFILNVARVGNHEAATFYLPGSRFWELLVGAMLAYTEVVRERRGRGDHPAHPAVAGANARAALGLLLLLAAFAGLDSRMLYPGWWALLPTLGAALLISAGMRSRISRVLLGNRVMVFVGLISYPLYLWHWPLLSYQRIIDPGQDTVPLRVGLLAAAFLLATFTYRFVERPIRSGPVSMRVAGAVMAVVAVLGLTGFLSLEGAIRPRSASYGLERYVAASTATAFPGPDLKPLRRPGQAAEPLLVQAASPRTVLFMGDSFVEQYYPRIDWLLRRNPATARTAVFATSGGCPPIPHVVEAHHPACNGLVQQAAAYAVGPDVEAVVIGANWANYFQTPDPRYSYHFDDGRTREPLTRGSGASERALAALSDMMLTFTRAGKRVYLVLPSPEVAGFDPRLMIHRSWRDMTFAVTEPVIARDRVAQPIAPLVRELRGVAAASGAQVIDPLDSLCGAVCASTTPDHMPIYRDGAHLNPLYVRERVRYLDDVVLPDSR